MQAQQTEKQRGTGALIALPFVLSWKLVTLVWTGLMEVRAWNKAQLQGSNAEIDTQRAEDQERWDKEQQRQQDAFDRDQDQEALDDYMYRW